MPNQRALGQKLVPVVMKQEFIVLLDRSLSRLGYSERARFIRDAIVEKLERTGIVVPKEFAAAPGRVMAVSEEVKTYSGPHVGLLPTEKPSSDSHDGSHLPVGPNSGDRGNKPGASDCAGKGGAKSAPRPRRKKGVVKPSNATRVSHLNGPIQSSSEPETAPNQLQSGAASMLPDGLSSSERVERAAHAILAKAVADVKARRK